MNIVMIELPSAGLEEGALGQPVAGLRLARQGDIHNMISLLL